MDSRAASSFFARLGRASKPLVVLFVLLAPVHAAAAAVDPDTTGSLLRPGLGAANADRTAVFESAYGETTLRARLGAANCLLMRLPGDWHLIAAADGVGLREGSSEAEVNVSLHEAVELGTSPGGNLAASYAAHLEDAYEVLLGRPVTVTTMEPVRSGAFRWRATWSDGNLDNAAHALSLQRYIVEAPGDAVIEIVLQGTSQRDENVLVEWILSSLQVRKPNCGS
jgi:hypothetical protein